MKTLRAALFFYSILLLSASCSGPEKEPRIHKSLIDLFHSNNEIPELTLKTNLSPLVEDRSRAFQPAVLEWPGRDTFQIEVKTRGKTRHEICDFPPLKFRFSESVITQHDLWEKPTLKLVTHCMSDSSLVLKEYLAYKIYNEWTEKSFRVQLIRLNYVNTEDANHKMAKYAFLIEHHGALAHRLGGEAINKEEPVRYIAQSDYERLTIFQYMIGNTDWNINRGHNIKMIQVKPGEAPIPVPYDFDFCGMINAPHAKPHPNLPIDSVQERFFQWRGKNKEGLRQQLDSIIAQKKQILEACEHYALLDAAGREEVRSYLESFFTTAKQALLQ